MKNFSQIVNLLENASCRRAEAFCGSVRFASSLVQLDLNS